VEEGIEYIKSQFGFSFGGGNSQRFNTSSRRGNQGRANYADSNDETDGRTMAGRQNDADEYTEQELQQFLRSAQRSEVDGSIDLRTTEGRALQAAGYIDDEGFEINDQSSSSRGRSSSRSSR
jgi:hypothetical protein